MVPRFASVYTLLFLSPRLCWRFGPGFHSSLVPRYCVLVLLILISLLWAWRFSAGCSRPGEKSFPELFGALT